jgi:predicted nucleotidyltransferase
MTLHEDLLAVARDITAKLLEKYGDEIVAVGLHGSVARGNVHEGSDIDFSVVTRTKDAVPSRELRVGDVLVSLGAVSRDEYLEDATKITYHWSLAKGEYGESLALHDPGGFFEELKDAWERAMAAKSEEEFLCQARDNLFEAYEWVWKASRDLAERSDAETAISLAEGLIATGLAVGLITKTTWTSRGEAVAQAAEAGAGIEGFSSPFELAASPGAELKDRLPAFHEALAALERHLAAKGAPLDVDSIDQLLL